MTNYCTPSKFGPDTRCYNWEEMCVLTCSWFLAARSFQMQEPTQIVYITNHIFTFNNQLSSSITHITGMILARNFRTMPTYFQRRGAPFQDQLGKICFFFAAPKHISDTHMHKSTILISLIAVCMCCFVMIRLENYET